jgi:predicted HTH transcriptional regulator
MNKLKVFISSVQTEFAEERQMLYDYILTDALLGRFFEPFLFEKLPACDIKASKAYLEQVKMSDVYLGIFGREYGFENKEGISPTELEFDCATKNQKIRLIFIPHHNNSEIHPKELLLIIKAEEVLVRKKFFDASELKTAVYASLVNLLEEKELIRSGPFDATICKEATFEDIDPERLKWFVRTASAKRNFPFTENDDPEKILTHLHLIKSEQLTNASLLLFGWEPQRFFITSEVRCAMFHGNEVQKPIPSYQVYKGDVFQLVEQAVDFVLSRIDLYVGDRSLSVDVPAYYEIPRTAVTEAIVNAVAHRDYTSNGSVQVMLFRNRLEVWNPGQLPYHLTNPKLKKPHGSFPANPLLAESLYLAGYIERMGTGIPDMIKVCRDAGLKEPELIQEESFKTILWRKVNATQQSSQQVTQQFNQQVTQQITQQIKNLILIIQDEMTRDELQEKLQLKDRENFRKLYILEALEQGLIEMTIPDKPTSPEQKYRLTAKGIAWQHQLKNQEK